MPRSSETLASISTADAVQALQIIVGLAPFTADHALACDADGNGQLTANDAVAILRYVVGLESVLPGAVACGSAWKFVPEVSDPVASETLHPPALAPQCSEGAIEFTPLSQVVQGRDFRAVMIGDCNGSWTPPSGLQQRAARAVAHDSGLVHLGRATRRGRVTRVPVYLSSENGPVRGLTLALHYDPAAWQFVRVRQLPGSSPAIIVVNPQQPGALRLAAATSSSFVTGRPAFYLEWRVRQRASRTALSVGVIEARAE